MARFVVRGRLTLFVSRLSALVILRIRPDLPAHERGGDMERLAQCGVRDYGAALLKVIRGLSAPPILIGHSLGGLVVQMAAAKTDCAALILLAPSAP